MRHVLTTTRRSPLRRLRQAATASAEVEDTIKRINSHKGECPARATRTCLRAHPFEAFASDLTSRLGVVFHRLRPRIILGGPATQRVVRYTQALRASSS